MELLEAAQYFKDKLRNSSNWPISRSIMDYRVVCQECKGKSEPSAKHSAHEPDCRYLQAMNAIAVAEREQKGKGQ